MPLSIARAVRSLEADLVVVYPTDTLFGLGARATSAAAVERVQRLKDRPTGMPLSIALSSTEEIEPYAELNFESRAVLRRELPGPVTFLLPASRRARREFSPAIVGVSGSIGIRVPDHPIARELARRVGPITATSANRHGAVPVRSLAEARRIFGTGVRGYVGGGPAPSGRPSTIVDLRGSTPRLIVR